MNDLERLKRAEEAEPMAVVVMDKMPESCADCPLEYDNLCCILVENLYRKRGDDCPLRPAIGIIEPNGHVVYLREDGEE